MKMLSDYLKKEITRVSDSLEKEAMKKEGFSFQKLHLLKELLETQDALLDYYEDMGASNNSMTYNHTDYYSKWLNNLANDDGTYGPHWTMAETTDVAKDYNIYFENISEKDWHMALNMIYSDYCIIAKKYNIDNIKFYVDMAKSWLWDKDTVNGKEKLCKYYEYIVKKN